MWVQLLSKTLQLVTCVYLKMVPLTWWSKVTPLLLMVGRQDTLSLVKELAPRHNTTIGIWRHSFKLRVVASCAVRKRTTDMLRFHHDGFLHWQLKFIAAISHHEPLECVQDDYRLLNRISAWTDQKWGDPHKNRRYHHTNFYVTVLYSTNITATNHSVTHFFLQSSSRYTLRCFFFQKAMVYNKSTKLASWCKKIQHKLNSVENKPW